MRRILHALALITLAGGAWYLYDPPWVAGVTSGLRDWEEDPPGARFRWTNGHASFYIPSDVGELTLPMRAVFASSDGKPVRVALSVDGRWLTNIDLLNPAEWTYPRVPLPRRTSRRRYRRIDVRVSRVTGFYNLGVELGEAQFPQ